MTASKHERSIADYAIIGDCRSAALISKRGSIDWLCWPYFASSSIFASLLDDLCGGSFSIQPVGSFRSERSYLPGTNVLVTRFVTSGGELELTDCMPVTSEARKRTRLLPEHELLRIVRCTAGRVELTLHMEPRPGYGRAPAPMQQRTDGLIACPSRGAVLMLDSSMPVSADNGVATARWMLEEGERHVVSLTYCDNEPAIIPGLGALADDRLRETIEWWQKWVQTCTYQGPYRDHLIRSLLTLKLLTFAPSGAIIAAPTTSLPEAPGGERNWDYRYCWIRDASMVVGTLVDLGYSSHASAYVSWLLHTTRRTAPHLNTVYDVFGKPRIPERSIESLAGFRNSRPVRVGNAARSQLQLDCYGELIAAVADYVKHGGQLVPSSCRLLVSFGEMVCQQWREPDEGMWEYRDGRRHNTFSKVMCWVALDELIRLHDAGVVKAPRQKFCSERDDLAQAIEERGFDADRNTYVAHFGGTHVDASLLLMPSYGYLDSTDPRAIGTRVHIESELARGHLMARYRHEDGLAGDEGAFGACCFWRVSCLASQGEVEPAREHLEALLACSNDVGLFAEQIAWDDGAPLGNFPQGLTHLGVIGAILSLKPETGRRADLSKEESV